MPDCSNTGTPGYFLPVVLWFFTYETTPPTGSATFCNPTISLWDVTVTVDIATGNLLSVEEIGSFNASSPFASLSGNVTGPPLNGRAYNGVAFNLTNADQFVIARANATDLQIPASIFQAATQAPGGLTAAFQTNSFVEMATQVYVSYVISLFSWNVNITDIFYSFRRVPILSLLLRLYISYLRMRQFRWKSRVGKSVFG